MINILKFILLLVLVFPITAVAAPSLPWATTYDSCSEWIDDRSTPPACSDLALGSEEHYDGAMTEYEQITAEANYPLGGGGLGQLHWLYSQDGGGGSSSSSGALELYLDQDYDEIWIRYYIKYVDDATWTVSSTVSNKMMFLTSLNSASNIVPKLEYADSVGAVQQAPTSTHYLTSGYGWDSIFSDGGWHCVEYHYKTDTNGVDGVWETWVDDTPVNSYSTINHAGEGLYRVVVGGNAHNVAIGYHKVYYDDIAVSATGRIGLLDATPVNGACGVASGQTFSSLTSSSDNLVVAGTTVYGFLETAGVGWTWGSLGADNGGIATDTAIDACSASYQASVPVDPTTGLTKGSSLFSESFEDDTWTSRAWYDGTGSTGTEGGGYSGNALKWTWTTGTTNPTGFSTLRNNLSSASDEFLIEYYVKYDTGWQGSGLASHPHLIHILSSEDTAYQGFAASNSNLYFEAYAEPATPYSNHPVFAHQDLMRAVSATNDLTAITETRSANNCDTPFLLTGATLGTCYADGDNWYSANNWVGSGVTIPENTWVKITAYVKMNTFTTGIGNFDGIMKLWVNADLAINSETVLYAAGAYEGSTWDKIALGPYMGGSPIAQSMWVDELSIWTIDSGTQETPGTITAYFLLDGSVIPYKMTTEQ